MRNPIRRSKKIGQTQGGRVKSGLAIEKPSRLFFPSTWEKLSDATDGLRIIRENPSKAYMHPAGPAQVRSVLDRLPSNLTEGVKVVVLRRIPKDDQKEQVDARKRYSCIILNAFARDLCMVWTRKPTRAVFSHMNPWCTRWKEKDGSWILQWTAKEIKRYYLYHLLLHEVGHFNGWFSSLKKREDFAENFALEWARKLGELPNDSIEATPDGAPRG